MRDRARPLQSEPTPAERDATPATLLLLVHHLGGQIGARTRLAADLTGASTAAALNRMARQKRRAPPRDAAGHRSAASCIIRNRQKDQPRPG